MISEQRKKIVLDGQTPYCPICGLTLRPGEIASHLEVELEKLDKLSRFVFEPPRGKTNNVVSEQVRQKPTCHRKELEASNFGFK